MSRITHGTLHLQQHRLAKVGGGGDARDRRSMNASIALPEVPDDLQVNSDPLRLAQVLESPDQRREVHPATGAIAIVARREQVPAC